MLSMERIILRIVEDPTTVHKDFRLYLSSMPSKAFPVSVLQNSVKVTNEPPKGLRANVRRALTDMLDPFFEDHPLGQQWKSMLFGICMFHANIQERKKFGALGWNITYEFNDSDREFAFNTLKMFCGDTTTIPWDALEYQTGEITYGGRVTDAWDLRCLKTILKGFFAPHTIAPNFVYSKSGIYYCPDLDSLQDTFPMIEEPVIFGMHENANIAFQTKETQTVLRTIVDSQPRSGGGGEGKSSDEIVFEIAQSVIECILTAIDMDAAHPNLFKRDPRGRMPSLTTVLTQEVDRFNKLLKLIHSSMKNLQKAIKGLVVMSEDLEEVFKRTTSSTATYFSQVPKMWSSKSYPSLKSLGSWVHDLELRLDFICTWIKFYHPPSYWLSGFYFTQGFLTGTLQTHATKYDLPIDQLKYDFKVQPLHIDQDTIKQVHDAEGREVPEAYGDVTIPKDGVIVHGIFLDAGRWDIKRMILVDPLPGEINPPLPAVHMFPVTKMPDIDQRYVCPLYKTSVRAGTLSTTGHSTNFVIAVLLPSKEAQNYWILKGTALLIGLTD